MSVLTFIGQIRLVSVGTHKLLILPIFIGIAQNRHGLLLKGTLVIIAVIMLIVVGSLSSIQKKAEQKQQYLEIYGAHTEEAYQNLKVNLVPKLDEVRKKYLAHVPDQDIKYNRSISVGAISGTYNFKKSAERFLDDLPKYSFTTYIEKRSPGALQFGLLLSEFSKVLERIEENQNFTPSPQDSVNYYALKELIGSDINSFLRTVNIDENDLGNYIRFEQVMKYSLAGYVDSTLCTRESFDQLIETRNKATEELTKK